MDITECVTNKQKEYYIEAAKMTKNLRYQLHLNKILKWVEDINKLPKYKSTLDTIPQKRSTFVSLNFNVAPTLAAVTTDSYAFAMGTYEDNECLHGIQLKIDNIKSEIIKKWKKEKEEYQSLELEKGSESGNTLDSNESGTNENYRTQLI